MFCVSCNAYLNIELTNKQMYLNPYYTAEWDLEWHEFHNVRYIFVKIFKQLHDQVELSKLICPVCSSQGKISVTLDGLFDIYLINRSLNEECNISYTCIRCEQKFVSHKCTIQTKRGYVCGDCAIFA